MADILQIEDGVLKGCSDKDVTSVAIPDGVRDIAWTAFRKCTHLQSLTIPKSVRHISKKAFIKCTSLSKIVLSDDFEKVPSEWFVSLNEANYEIVCTKDSSTYKSVRRSPHLRTHVKEIALQIAKEKKVSELKEAGMKALLGTLLENVGDSSFEIFQNKKGSDVALFKMGKNAGFFKLCSNHSRWLPKIQKVAESFANSSKSGAEILAVIEAQKLPLAEIPQWWRMKTVLKADSEGSLRVFASGTLFECKYDGLKNLELFGVTEIGARAFDGCTSLSSVEIPSSVTEIGARAFFVCTALSSVEIPPSVTEIGESAFWNCTALSSVEIPPSVTEIGESAFYGCTALSSVEIPSSVTEIGDKAFRDCNINELSHPCLTIKNGVVVKGIKVLYCASQRGSVTIPDGVTEIGTRAFAGCASPVSVVIPPGVTEIGNYAFWNCKSLSSVEIPPSVTEIGESAFEGCESLTSVEIPSSVTEFGDKAFRDCNINELSHPCLTIKNGVVVKGIKVLYCASQRGSVTIPDGVTEIGKYAFNGCKSLSSVVIPPSVTEIGEMAFFGCSSLESIEFGGTVSQWKAVEKGEDWHKWCNVASVKCSDGEAEL